MGKEGIRCDSCGSCLEFSGPCLLPACEGRRLLGETVKEWEDSNGISQESLVVGDKKHQQKIVGTCNPIKGGSVALVLRACIIFRTLV